MKKSGYILSVFLMLAAACSAQPDKKKVESQSATDSKTITNTTEDHSNAAGIVHITKADFMNLVMDYEKNPDTWKYKGEIPCIVDFYADWCAPCRITSPILEELAREYSGKINVYKVDIEKERELAGVFGVQSIPTFLFCPMDGNPTISSGIANTPDATRDMFRGQIEQILLKKGNSTNL